MQPQQLAAQLRCPSGDSAIAIGQSMNEANKKLNHQCFAQLHLEANDSILEIGSGNGAFVESLVLAADSIHYRGIDLSPKMVEQAQLINRSLMTYNDIQFVQGSSAHLPFKQASFTKAFCVHTIYFWQKPLVDIAEIYRTLCPGGLFCVAFGDRKFMQHLPFPQYGFNLYSQQEVCDLFNTCRFKVIYSAHQQERGKSNTGKIVDKLTNIIVGQK